MSETTPLRVLLVDDNDLAAELLAEFVGIVGHQVHVAGTATEGLALATEHAPQVAIVDIILPDMDGYQLAKRLRAQFGANLLILALSGLPRNADHADDAVFDGWLEKPVDLAALESRLQQAAAERAS
ncbi:response regulator [Orrella dioscoreae]|uniref:Chemotaxis protein methyltransferase CheR n=2 Tax=root TaxID=1 RepID=A0A1C3JWQ6_9BURK|nr:response regulator [Orrella dioscoreae]SBT23712.1 Chemotaxis protein methyltransferase CheR [Orrella dioscoreae]SOE47692.1 Chemotaxis protein methyltransferase CheR [Orrella dioscoreae]